ncbi:MAG: YegS/Rv2252/BmrU family lipid kinase [Oscillospiraceae bacterium]|nr:YegS/Rv2252/BmrU family lipid kinase [Oscillospiraceae bacterium]
MKHIFVVNPVSGKGKSTAKIVDEINGYCSQNGLNYTIHQTKAPGDGLEYAREMAATGEPMRIYACGGDGTLYEVVNGVYGYSNVEVAAIPLGSGNDFIRLFGTKEELVNIEAQVNGTAIELDLIRCGDRLAINECSMGMDAEVCAKQFDFKKIPWLSGEAAYTVSLLWAFTKKIKSTFTVTIDDDEPFTEDVVFCYCGNSRWYGGGYMAGPIALPDDGWLDVVIVKKEMSRLKLLSLINKYKRGEHLDWDVTMFRRAKKVTVHCDTPAAVNVDGECDYVNDSSFEIIEKGIKFVIPTVSAYIQDRASGKIHGEMERYIATKK